MPRAGQIDFGRLPRAITARDRAGAIGRTADDFTDIHLALMAVGQADNGETEVQQVGDDGE